MTAPKPNADLAYKVLDQIDADPKSWIQAVWDCGTAACFAGWAVRLSGGKSLKEELETVVIDAPKALGITGLPVDEAAERLLGHTCRTGDEDLFDPSNSRHDLGRLVAEIFGPRPEPTYQVLFVRQDGTAIDVTPEPGEDDDVPPNAGSAS